MSDSLRDQLLGLGFKPAPKPASKPATTPAPSSGKAHGGAARPGRDARRDAREKDVGARRPDDASGARAAQGKRRPGGSSEMDLAKAYAIRAQREKQERIAAEQRRQEEARQRREARQKLGEALQGKALNVADADIARHFPYGGKIKRIYVTAEQLRALNAGELGVVQLDGRYVLVDAPMLALAESIFAPSVALKVDPDAPAADDPYAYPKYQVPDDLVW